jgi:hypothetical protein
VTSAAADRGAPYEIVVRGVVGPATRAALLPARTSEAEHEAVLRTRLLPDHDLADLVAHLRARGFRVTSIAVLD